MYELWKGSIDVIYGHVQNLLENSKESTFLHSNISIMAPM
jgi:hypothetical protein